jgi:VWFA-related protein
VSLRTLAVLLPVLLTSLSIHERAAAQEQATPEAPTLRVNSNLVFLDIVVLDKHGKPVVKGLAKDDFTITEEKKPQSIFSFETPDEHPASTGGDSDNFEEKSARTIFVLDLLNSRPEDFAFIRSAVRGYLYGQPKLLARQAELMVVGNRTLEMLQGFTRDRDELQYALKHLPPIVPYKQMNMNFMAERFAQSIEALQEIALQNKGVPGRKNVIWIGDGPPTVDRSQLMDSGAALVDRYVHLTTNMLVDSRITLYAISPYLRAEGKSIQGVPAFQNGDNGNPFVGDVNFGLFTSETGGQLLFNRNDVDTEIKHTEESGANYYTLTYQPHEVDPDGKLRRISVSMRDPNLRAVTKAGYFAPDKTTNLSPREMSIVNSIDAARAVIPFTALDVKITHLVRHSDSRRVEFVVELRSKALGWHPATDGRSSANLTVVAASLSDRRQIIASRVDRATLSVPTQDPVRLGQEIARFPLSVRMPKKTKSIRVVLQTEEAGRIGSADLDAAAIEAAPEVASPTEENESHSAN